MTVSRRLSTRLNNGLVGYRSSDDDQVTVRISMPLSRDRNPLEEKGIPDSSLEIEKAV